MLRGTPTTRTQRTMASLAQFRRTPGTPRSAGPGFAPPHESPLPARRPPRPPEGTGSREPPDVVRFSHAPDASPLSFQKKRVPEEDNDDGDRAPDDSADASGDDAVDHRPASTSRALATSTAPP